MAENERLAFLAGGGQSFDSKGRFRGCRGLGLLARLVLGHGLSTIVAHGGTVAALLALGRRFIGQVRVDVLVGEVHVGIGSAGKGRHLGGGL